jgi:Leucine-rich repeat (LRR) protein
VNSLVNKCDFHGRCPCCFVVQNVSYNQIADISPNLGCMTRLRRLNVSHNGMLEIPSTLCQLKSN